MTAKRIDTFFRVPSGQRRLAALAAGRDSVGRGLDGIRHGDGLDQV